MNTNNDMYFIGQKVIVADRIEPTITNTGIIKLIEQDQEYEGLLWLYIRADNESLNDKTDPKLNCTYFELLEAHSDRVGPVLLEE